MISNVLFLSLTIVGGIARADSYVVRVLKDDGGLRSTSSLIPSHYHAGPSLTVSFRGFGRRASAKNLADAAAALPGVTTTYLHRSIPFITAATVSVAGPVEALEAVKAHIPAALRAGASTAE
jgi:hypothetical protein